LHKELRELPVYELEIGKKGPKLSRAKDSEESSVRPKGGEVEYRNISMEDFARRLPGFPFRMDRPVIDRSGLKGGYDFRIRIADSMMEMKTSMEHAEEGFASGLIQSQLGLKLRATKDPVNVLVVDTALRVPVEN
jgi:uncharacterized protein (TIGR03435 family)